MATAQTHLMAAHIIPTWTLGDRLAKARDCAGLTNHEMADALGVSRNTVTNWETGHTQPKRYAVEAWARITGVDLDWLVGGERVSAERHPHKPRPSRGSKMKSAQGNRMSPCILDSPLHRFALARAA